MNQADAIVVGAGIAGLSAACELSRHGARVSVLEARPRPGGRILTKHPTSWHPAVELGAEFVHGEDPELIELVKDAELTLKPVEGLHFSLEGGELEAASGFYDVEELILRAANHASSKSARDFLMDEHVDPRASAWVSHFVEGFHAAPLDRVSAQSLAEQGTPQEDQFQIQEGYGALVDYLERDAGVRGVHFEYLEPVREIRVRPNGVEVQGSRDAWHAKTAIVAVPLSILRASPLDGGIAFDPRPEWLDALTRGYDMGEAQRLVIRLREPLDLHTELPEGAFFHVLGAEVPTFWLTGSETEPQVTAWCGGPRAAAWALSTDPVAVALESLAGGLHKNVAELGALVLGAHAHDFVRDPRTRGAYPYRLAEREALRPEDVVARPPLVVAGDFLEEGALGTVGAAARSGLAAARTVLARG
jgi:hypothetical protein